MTAIDFPNSPTTGQSFSSGTRTWTYTGTVWQVVPVELGTNLDGGKASSVYGGISPVQGGNASSF
jgi:hypothetical protein